jgi:two-component system response regulator HydG/two-component system response regulator AtoC
MEHLRQQIRRAARVRANVLITGETGTGKELVAGAMHYASPRGTRRFLSVNCAALPDALLESELFGHARGAFTGAYQSRAGLFQDSDGGTAFLDEVGELSLYAQAKLLRVIESKEVQRLGESHSQPIDLRVVAATNRSLEEMVENGQFRKDLFYRLNVVRIQVPPLRERPEDIPALVAHYIRILNSDFGIFMEGMEPAALERLCVHAWPGNVRELRNLLEAAYVNCEGRLIRCNDLPDLASATALRSSNTGSEKQRLISVLASVNWNKSKAAAQLHWSRMTLYRKLAKYGIAGERAAEV